MLQYTEQMDNDRMIGIIQRVCNHVDSRLMDHGLRVSYIVSRLLRSLGTYELVQQRDICFLALLHDVGAYKTEEIDKMVQFETGSVWNHSIYGFLFMNYFSPLRYLAPAILLHHTPWSELKDSTEVSRECKELAQLINIADRADVYMNSGDCTWDEFIKELEWCKDKKFAAYIVDLIAKEELSYPLADAWSDVGYQYIMGGVSFTQPEITAYLNMLIYVIDFRSHHTVTHTITTTSISYELAELMNLDERVNHQIVCGALLHDLGKIGIPVEILECPSKLDPQQMAVMRSHVDITEEIFGGDIEEVIQRISLRHHEKLDGSGYPMGLCGENLTIPERIVAVADIVSALAGIRSYKGAYDKGHIVAIIENMRDGGLIDKEIVSLMVLHFDIIMEKTSVRCDPILEIYHKINEEYHKIHRMIINYQHLQPIDTI